MPNDETFWDDVRPTWVAPKKKDVRDDDSGCWFLALVLVGAVTGVVGVLLTAAAAAVSNG